MSHHFAYRTTWAEQRGNSFFLFLDSNSVWTCLVEVQTLCHVVIVVCKRHVQMSPVWHRHWQSSSRATAAPHTHKSTLLTEHWSVLLLSHTPMQRRVGELLGLGLYKAGRAASWSKHFHTRSRRKQEERRTPGTFFFPKPNSPTDTCQNLKWLPSCRWVFPSHQHSGLSTARLRLADPCSGGLFWPVFNLVQLWMSCVINGSYWRLGGMLKKSRQLIPLIIFVLFFFSFQQGEKYSAGTKSRVLSCASVALSLLV